MKLSSRSRYGIRILIDIAMNESQGPVKTEAISKRRGITVKYCEKIIRLLKNSGFLEGQRGPKGGQVLSRPAEQIRVSDIVRAMEEPILADCIDEPNHCRISDTCITREIWTEIKSAIYERLDKITLEQLVRKAASSDCQDAPCC